MTHYIDREGGVDTSVRTHGLSDPLSWHVFELFV